MLAGSPPLLSPNLASAELSGGLPGAGEPSGFLMAPLGSICPFAHSSSSLLHYRVLGPRLLLKERMVLGKDHSVSQSKRGYESPGCSELVTATALAQWGVQDAWAAGNVELRSCHLGPPDQMQGHLNPVTHYSRLSRTATPVHTGEVLGCPGLGSVSP